MIATVNSSFLRRSGVRNALEKAESNFFLLRGVPPAPAGRERLRSGATDIPNWERTLTVLPSRCEPRYSRTARVIQRCGEIAGQRPKGDVGPCVARVDIPRAL